MYSVNVGHVVLSDIRSMYAGPRWGSSEPDVPTNRTGQIQEIDFEQFYFS